MAGVRAPARAHQVHGEELRRGDCRGSVWVCVAGAASGRSDHELQPAGRCRDGGRPLVAAMRLGTGEREASSWVRGFCRRGPRICKRRDSGCWISTRLRLWVTGGLGSDGEVVRAAGDAGAEVQARAEADHRQSGHTGSRTGESLGGKTRIGTAAASSGGAEALGWLKRRGPRAEQQRRGGKDCDLARV
ncbi:hypothetical protein ACJRO7_033111 [Eucalyptus globulus]|uniref:Uncharacterized protein n=1 Tax=Eucalyptus globulus TaxID=34317 RepID=A0ABD3JVW2_EUCGL